MFYYHLFQSPLALLLVGFILSANSQDDKTLGGPPILQAEQLDGFSDGDDIVDRQECRKSILSDVLLLFALIF